MNPHSRRSRDDPSPVRRPEKRRDTAGVPLWVITYGDMMSLLLVFFIFVCSIGEIRFERSEDRSDESGQMVPTAERSQESASLLFHTGYQEQRSKRGAPLLLTLFFEPGKDRLPESEKERLRRLAPLLWSSPVPLVVAGYVSPFVDLSKGASLRDADRRAFDRALEVVQVLADENTGMDGSRPGEPRFLPASGAFHGGPLDGHGLAASEGRDRVDIFPIRLERR